MPNICNFTNFVLLLAIITASLYAVSREIKANIRDIAETNRLLYRSCYEYGGVNLYKETYINEKTNESVDYGFSCRSTSPKGEVEIVKLSATKNKEGKIIVNRM